MWKIEYAYIVVFPGVGFNWEYQVYTFIKQMMCVVGK